MSNRYFSDHKERHVAPAKKYRHPSTDGGSGETKRIEDTEVKWKNAGPEQKGGLNRVTKFPEVKIAVVEHYDGDDD